MSFATIFKTPIANFTATAKKLDERMKVFCIQLAKRLEVDEAKLIVEFEACLKLFEMEEFKTVEKLVSKKLSEEEKEEKKRIQEEEKARKIAFQQLEKEKKEQEKRELAEKKKQEKELEKEKKEQEKLELAEKKKQQKEKEKELKKMEKEAKKSEKSPKSNKVTPVKLNEGFDFDIESVPFDKDSDFWKDGKTKTIQGQKRFIHEETKLILSFTDDEVILFGIKTGDKTAVLEKDMTNEELTKIREWSKDCGIYVPSLAQDENDEEEEDMELDLE
jgi:hypothetical protein